MQTLPLLHSFIWNVLLHWQALITGGLVTAMFAMYQGVSGKQLSKKMYIAVFVLAAFIWSCFLAWTDEHRNTTVVIGEKSEAQSRNYDCGRDLLSTRATLQGKEELIESLQKNLSALQAPQLQQQATINSCVLTLGKLNPVVSTDIEVTVVSVANQTVPSLSRFGPTSKKYFSAVVISTSRKSDPKGVLKCASPFDPSGTPYLPLRHSGLTSPVPAKRISDREVELTVTSSVSEWNSTTPLLLVITSTQEQIGPCTFQLST